MEQNGSEDTLGGTVYHDGVNYVGSVGAGQQWPVRLRENFH